MKTPISIKLIIIYTHFTTTLIAVMAIVATTTTNESANLIFDLINSAEQFGNQKINVIICGTDNNRESWFKGKDIATILGYDNTTKSIRDNIDKDDRLSLEELYAKVSTDNTHPTSNKNQLKTVYINESGLYSLILNSKLPSAKQFKKWITRDLLPKIRKVGQEKYLQQIQQLQIENKEKDDQLNRLHNIQIELLSYKKKVTKNETVYIVSTENYSRQGIFKIGRTKNDMKFRSSGHNITHITGDTVEVLASFKVGDSVSIEKNIHNKLNGLLLKDEKEFFMCPFDLLQSLVELVVNNDDTENQTVNKIIDTVYRLKQRAFSSIDWTQGIPTDIFKKKMILTGSDKKQIEFDVTRWTDEYKNQFIANCIKEYIKINNNTTDAEVQIIWKTFQTFLIEQLPIVKSKYKSKEWKEHVKNSASTVKAGTEQKQPSIKWK